LNARRALAFAALIQVGCSSHLVPKHATCHIEIDARAENAAPLHYLEQEMHIRDGTLTATYKEQGVVKEHVRVRLPGPEIEALCSNTALEAVGSLPGFLQSENPLVASHGAKLVLTIARDGESHSVVARDPFQVPPPKDFA